MRDAQRDDAMRPCEAVCNPSSIQVTQQPLTARSGAFSFSAEATMQSAETMQSTDSLMFITTRPDVTFVRGEGSWLYDNEGRKYLDFIQGWAVNSLGHSPKVILDALAAQAGKVINVSTAYYNEPMRRLAARLAELSGMEKVFFTNSGAEANEGAIKLARKWGSLRKGGAYEILTFENGFHGRTLATMAASGKPQWEHL